MYQAMASNSRKTLLGGAIIGVVCLVLGAVGGFVSGRYGGAATECNDGGAAAECNDIVCTECQVTTTGGPTTGLSITTPDSIIQTVAAQVNASSTQTAEYVGRFLIGGVSPLQPDALSASSVYSASLNAKHGRFYYPSAPTSAWCAKTADGNVHTDWLQVDLGAEMRVDGFATKGRNHPSTSEWVTSYKVSYFVRGTDTTFEYIQNDNGDAMLFPGNVDRDSMVVHYLQEPIFTQKVKFHPYTHSSHTCMRVELIQLCKPLL